MARVLLIEDNDANMRMIKYLLEVAGHEAYIAMDGPQGLELAGKHLPDLILCDIQLPEMDGYEVLRKLREQENTKHLPVVAVSSFAMVGDRDKALRAGFDGYLSKPINARTFLNEVFQIAKIKID